MEQSRNKLITEAYAAFNRRDIDSVLALMASDVNWPNGMEGGRLVGHDLVRAYWIRQWGVLSPRVDPVGLEEDRTGSRGGTRPSSGSRPIGQCSCGPFRSAVYSFKGDLIDRMDIRDASDPLRQEFPMTMLSPQQRANRDTLDSRQ